MTIPHNENGWAYDNSIGNWKLVYERNQIVIFEQTDQCIATQSILFVGTKQECEQEMIRLGLPLSEWQQSFNSQDDELDSQQNTQDSGFVSWFSNLFNK
jgi:hypothetical protein